MQHTTLHLMPADARQDLSFTRGSGACLGNAQDVKYLDAMAGG